MFVNYRIWLKDRENPQSRIQIIVGEPFVDDLLEEAHNLMLKHTDNDWVCYRVDLVEIEDFII